MHKSREGITLYGFFYKFIAKKCPATNDRREALYRV